MMQEWTEEIVNENINKDGYRFLYFYTPLCGTCQLAKKMLEVSEKVLPDVNIGAANLNYMPDKASEFKIESVPCLLILKDGKLEEKVYAFHSVENIIGKLGAYESALR